MEYLDAISKGTTLAARFFFRNCAVSIHLPGVLTISNNLTPGLGDIVFDRDFVAAKSPTEFIGSKSDFYRFLDGTSSSNSSIIKKMGAIGYILSNKLPRHNPTRCRSFLCVNESEAACCNGKTLFYNAIELYCDTVRINGRNGVRGHFAFSEVSEKTQLVCIDDLPARVKYCQFFEKCTDDWVVNRKARDPLVIEHAKSPHLLITSNLPMSKVRKDGGFRRRFVVLEFSDFFGMENRIDEFLGRRMFIDWDSEQWNIFDNLMFYCITQYVKALSLNYDLFRE